jgi:hypothetical protein
MSRNSSSPVSLSLSVSLLIIAIQYCSNPAHGTRLHITLVHMLALISCVTVLGTVTRVVRSNCTCQRLQSLLQLHPAESEAAIGSFSVWGWTHSSAKHRFSAEEELELLQGKWREITEYSAEKEEFEVVQGMCLHREGFAGREECVLTLTPRSS